MADILKISTPLIDKSPVQQPRAIDPTQPFVLGDVTRVAKPADASELLQQNNGLAEQEQGPKLLTDLVKNPSVTVGIMRNIYMLQEIANLLPANNTPLTEEIRSLFEQLMLSPADIEGELANQEQNTTLFKGELFDSLRALLDQHRNDPLVQRDIGVLLKSLTAQISNRDALDSVANNLVFIRSQFSAASPFADTLEKMIQAYRQPQAPENFSALKNELFQLFEQMKTSPFYSHELDKVIPLVTYNLSRYNDSREFFPMALTQLLDKLPDGAAKDSLMHHLARFFETHFPQGLLDTAVGKNTLQADRESSVMDTLAKIIGRETKDEDIRLLSGNNVERIIHSLLSSPCNFTPLLHFILPVSHEGISAFAEIWIDPNAENAAGETARNGEGSLTHTFIVFDIQHVGKFEMEILAKGKRLAIGLLCPPKHVEAFRAIGGAIRGALRSSPFVIETVNVGRFERSRSLMDVFKDLPHRRTGVNVKI